MKVRSGCWRPDPGRNEPGRVVQAKHNAPGCQGEVVGNDHEQNVRHTVVAHPEEYRRGAIGHDIFTARHHYGPHGEAHESHGIADIAAPNVQHFGERQSRDRAHNTRDNARGREKRMGLEVAVDVWQKRRHDLQLEPGRECAQPNPAITSC